MEYIFYIFTFIFGAIFGSFLNVVIYRHNTEITIMGRSFCFSCNKQLSWYELFPILSFLALRGKCLTCKSKISRQYVIVETSMGILVSLLFWKLGGFSVFADKVAGINGTDWGWIFSTAVFLILLCLLVLIGVYDLKHKIIPDKFSYTFAILAFFKLLFLSGTYLFELTMWDLFAGIILAAPFALLWLVSQGRWMGLGDAKLALGIGWFLGLRAGFTAIVMSFWIGAAFGVLLIVAGKLKKYSPWKSRVNMKTELPFAPFLILGLLLVFFVPSIMDTVGSLFF